MQTISKTKSHHWRRNWAFFLIEDTFRLDVLEIVFSTDELKEKKSWKWSLGLRDKVFNMESDAFHETLVIGSFKVIKVEGKKTNMLGKM